MVSQRFDSQRFNLTHGDIGGKLLQVSVPIVGTQLLLMSYNLVDMFLLGRLSSDAVASSGSAGMYMWLANGLVLIGRLGAEIGVAQCSGRRDKAGALLYSQNALLLAFVFGTLFGLACIFAPGPLIGVLNIQERHVAADAEAYLAIVGFGMPALFLGASIAGAFTGSGNSRTPFFVNAVGLIVNAVLDPLCIFTFGMGVRGAAIATVIAMYCAFSLSLFWLFTKRDRPFGHYVLFKKPVRRVVSRILRWSVPISIEAMLFTVFSMMVARYVADFGADAIAAFRVGSQAESLSWLICLGFSTGITAFVGQNFGAGEWGRIWSCLRIATVGVFVYGVFLTALFLICNRGIIGLLIPDPVIIDMGARYLWILAWCQLVFCLESVASGAFRGFGRTLPPSLASICSNGVRVFVVAYLSSTSLELEGVWLGITLCATFRGLWVFIWFLLDRRNRPRATSELS